MSESNLKLGDNSYPVRDSRASIDTVVASHELWLGIYFPELDLAAHQAPDDVPFSLLQAEKGKTRVYQANHMAQQQGIVPGMPLNAAYALCQELRSMRRDPGKEQEQLRDYAQAVMCFTPRIVLSDSPPDTLLLEVRASLGLFGGITGLQQQLDSVFKAVHVTAWAPCIDAAELMARQGLEKRVRSVDELRSVLGTLPIAHTTLQQDRVHALAHCGLHYLRDLWRLPRADLARRFGPGLVQYLDRLSGQKMVPRVSFEAPERLILKHEINIENSNIKYILNVSEYLLDQAGQFLQKRASVSEKISFRLIYAPQRGAMRRWLDLDIHAQQGGDRPAHFLPQLNENLQRLSLEAPLDAIELRIEQFKRCNTSTRDLFSRVVQREEPWPVLLDLLFARLGTRHIYRLGIKQEYRPGAAWYKRSARKAVPQQTDLGRLFARPIWLFKQVSRCSSTRFKLLGDAERLESGWWDGQDQRREYYQGLAPSGQRCWLYRDLGDESGAWYMHGLFG